MSDDPLCVCGHPLSEHDVTYGWAKGRRFCSGVATAVTRSDLADCDGVKGRSVSCQCDNFVAADDWQLAEWGDA